MSDIRDGVCPKCGSTEVYYGKAAGPSSNFVFSAWAIRVTKIYNYVCTDCGYTESYIFDKDALRQIAEKWQHAVQLQKKKRNDEG